MDPALAEPFANRLRKNRRHLARWARREGTDCYRLYDADLPEFNLALDLYRDWAHVQEYAPPRSIDPAKARARLEAALATIPGVLEIPPDQVVLKVRQRQRGRGQYRRLDRQQRELEVHEGGLRFLVNLGDYLDTGLFLDHRTARGLVRGLAAGRDVLNLFAYTGSVTVYAAAGGARSTTTVDLSRTYLDWAARNLALNGLDGPAHRRIQADCRDWLRRCEQRFGLIFLDPPTFSNSKRMATPFDIQRDQVELIRDAAACLTDDGTLLFSTNRRGFTLAADALAPLRITEITRRTLPEDFRREPPIHRCWRIEPADRAAGAKDARR